jgi:methionyl aminopeptidase
VSLIKTKAEIAKMRAGGQILGEVLHLTRAKVCPGISTRALEVFVEGELSRRGAEPSFKNFRGYPASLCVSINEEVVHGIPGKRLVKKGDIVSLDLGVRYKGLYTDAALSLLVSPSTQQAKELVGATERALEAAIAAVAAGKTLGEVGAAVEKVAKTHSLAVVRDLVGHGVGHRVHEEPQIPNYGQAGKGLKLKEGMTLALEPMLTTGRPEVKCLPDGWTFVTVDGSLAAHFEHTVAVTAGGCEVLTE